MNGNIKCFFTAFQTKLTTLDVAGNRIKRLQNLSHLVLMEEFWVSAPCLCDFSLFLNADTKGFNLYPAELIYLNFQPLEVVSRYRDTQLQVPENYSYSFNLSTNNCK